MNDSSTVDIRHAWRVTPAEAWTIIAIAERASALSWKWDGIEPYAEVDVMVDLIAAHMGDTPLDLVALLAFDDTSFGHDVFGIRRYVDRVNGSMSGHFRPRCARRGGAS